MENKYPTDLEIFRGGVAFLARNVAYRDEPKSRVQYAQAWIRVIRRGQSMPPEDVRDVLGSAQESIVVGELAEIILDQIPDKARDWEIDEAIKFFTDGQV